MTWYDALTLNRSWDRERDTQRIRTAFVSLTAQSRRWPAPADLIAALPPAPERKKIGRVECDEAHRKRNRQHLAAVTAELKKAVEVNSGSTRR